MREGTKGCRRRREGRGRRGEVGGEMLRCSMARGFEAERERVGCFRLVQKPAKLRGRAAVLEPASLYSRL